MLLLGSSGAMVFSILLLTLALSNPGQVWTSPLAVVAVVSFVMAFGIGMGPVPWLLPAELFPADKVASGSALAASCNWLANFVCGLRALQLLHGLRYAVCRRPRLSSGLQRCGCPRRAARRSTRSSRRSAPVAENGGQLLARPPLERPGGLFSA